MRIRPTVIATPEKGAALQKEVVARIQSRITPVYLVNEYPKSGGTWLKFMLAEALDCPAWTKGAPVWAPCVMQAHWIAPKGKCKTIILVRDGRDVMVSYYYHALFRNEFQNGALVRIMRDRLRCSSYEDIRGNLVSFMREMIENPVSPGFSWIDFIHAWAHRPDVVICRYEDLRRDSASEIRRIYEAVTGEQLDRRRAVEIAEAYSMEKMRDRKKELHPGLKRQSDAEISFIRKGGVGGWSEHFTDEALAWFEERAGTALDALGYPRGRPEEET